MSASVRIRLIKAWGYAAPGAIIDPPPGVAALLIERGIAERVEDQKQGFTDRWNKRETRPPQPQREVRRGK